MDTGAAATFPLATERADYSALRFGWEFPNVQGRQLFQAALTTFNQKKSLLVARSFTFWVMPVGMTCQPICVTDSNILTV